MPVDSFGFGDEGSGDVQASVPDSAGPVEVELSIPESEFLVEADESMPWHGTVSESVIAGSFPSDVGVDSDCAPITVSVVVVVSVTVVGGTEYVCTTVT